MSHPVTTIIPCYNSADTVLRAIDSARRQNAGRIIVVDDGSTDDSVERIRSGAEDVQLICQKNRGAPAARNTGLAEADTEFVQFLDADDELLEGKIEAQRVLLGPSQSTAFVAAAYFRQQGDQDRTTRNVQTDDVWCACIRAELGITSANLFRRAAVQQVGGWNESLRSSQEYDLMFRLLAAGFKAEFDPIPRTVVHHRDTSITNSAGVGKWAQFCELRDQIRDHLVKHDLLTDQREQAIQEICFLACRSAFPVDQSFAVALKRQFVDVNYRPTRYRRAYRILYRLLGFRLTERLLQGRR